MLKENTLRKQKGILLSDTIVAILIVLIFTGILTSLIKNIVLQNVKIKMSSQHIDFAIEVLEYAEKLSYAEVTEQNLIAYINNKEEDNVSASINVGLLTTPYKIEIDVENYNERAGNTDKLDILKIVTVTVETDIEDKTYSTTISSVKKATNAEIKSLLE